MRLNEVKTGVCCSGAVVRAPTSTSATGSPHTIAARNGITNAQFLEQDPVLASNPQFGQEGVVFSKCHVHKKSCIPC